MPSLGAKTSAIIKMKGSASAFKNENVSWKQILNINLNHNQRLLQIIEQ